MDNSLDSERLIELEELEKLDWNRRVWKECKMIWRIAFPGILARISQFGIIVVTQLFLGHISKLDLAAFSLDQSIFVRFVNGILIGMSSATETLCGQAYGARQYHMMGIYLQRSWVVDGAIATILLPLFIFTTPILRHLGQDPEIAAVAGKFSFCFIPFLYSFVFFLTIQMYLQSQIKNKIIGWLSSSTFLFHILFSWTLVTKLGLGIVGAMTSLNVSSWLVVIGEFVYIFGGWCPNTWKGFSKAAIVDIWPVVKLSMSSALMLCLELWYFSILLFLAGYMKNAATEIAAFSICLVINNWTFTVCLGFLGTTSVRVSNELGKGNAKGAIFCIKVILTTSTCYGVLLWAMCLVFGKQIPYLFTSDEGVAQQVSSLSLLLAFTLLLNSVQPILSGAAIGAGMQGVVALVNLGCYYGIGVPLGALLAYVAHLQVKGLWIGLLTGVAMQTLILSFIIWRTDWDEQVNKAFGRLDRWILDSSNESNESCIPTSTS